MSRSGRWTTFVAVVLIAFAVYWRTAYPTITWWDSSVYSLAARTLGITSPPGSLLVTLIGWPVANLPVGTSPARNLNVLAGFLAALTAGMVFLVAWRVHRATSPTTHVVAMLGAAAGALTLAFTTTLWEHAIKFTPYVLTALFTTLILYTLVRWWDTADDPGAWRWLMLLGLLFGLDFSVHRTNSLLIPGALVWIALRNSRVFKTPRSVLGGSAGFLAGLSVQLLLIPIARFSHSPVNMFDTSTPARLWSYVSLEPYGGNFLLNLWPRKSGFWSVQVMDVVRTFADNFAGGRTTSLIIALSAIAGLLGFVMLLRRARSMGVALLALLFSQFALTVIYFNIPSNFFRPFDRHYLPMFVIWGVAMAFGLAGVAQRIRAARGQNAAAIFAAAALLMVALPQAVANWHTHDASRRFFAADFARNLLEALPPNAILFTAGDNDTFPLAYLQGAEGVRPDVRALNIGLTGVDWYRDQVLRRDASFPMTPSTEALLTSVDLRAQSGIAIPVEGTPDSVTIHPKPAFRNEFWSSDSTFIDILIRNRWVRPVAFAITVGNLGWIAPNATLEGLHWRIQPRRDAADESAVLRANLTSRYNYRGYADSTIWVEPESRTMALQYTTALMKLMDADRVAGRTDECNAARTTMMNRVPANRLPAALPPFELAC